MTLQNRKGGTICHAEYAGQLNTPGGAQDSHRIRIRICDRLT